MHDTHANVQGSDGSVGCETLDNVLCTECANIITLNAAHAIIAISHSQLYCHRCWINVIPTQMSRLVIEVLDWMHSAR
jgi:hypothetical protein